MNTASLNTRMKAGTAGGTTVAFLASLSHDLLQTILLSATGAAVSFLVSWLLRWALSRRTRNRTRRRYRKRTINNEAPDAQRQPNTAPSLDREGGTPEQSEGVTEGLTRSTTSRAQRREMSP